MITFYLIITINVFIVILATTLNHDFTIYSPKFLKNNQDILIGILAWVGVLMLLISLLKTKINLIFIITVIILTTSLSNTGSGIKGALFNKDWNESYHKISKYINSLQKLESPVWVSFQQNKSIISNTNQENVLDTTTRLKRIYDAFYNDNELNVIFSSKEPESYRTIITNRLDLAFDHQFSYEFAGKGSPSNSFLGKTIPIKKIKEYANYGIKVGGLRGDATIEKVLVDDAAFSKVVPIQSQPTFELQLDYSNGLFGNVEEDTIFFLSANNALAIDMKPKIQLFLQYQKSGKWVRTVTNVNNNNKLPKLQVQVPKEATKLSYGWYIDGKNLKEPIMLPNISATVANVPQLDKDHTFLLQEVGKTK